MMAHRTFSDDLPKAGESGGNGAPDGGAPALARREDFRLGAAMVRPSLRSVEGPGGSAAAEPRVMQVLLALADANGMVLTRDDLVRICWDRRIVGDDSISRAIAEVRRIARETRGRVRRRDHNPDRLSIDGGSGRRGGCSGRRIDRATHPRASSPQATGRCGRALGRRHRRRALLVSSRSGARSANQRAWYRKASRPRGWRRRPAMEKAIELLEQAVAATAGRGIAVGKARFGSGPRAGAWRRVRCAGRHRGRGCGAAGASPGPAQRRCPCGQGHPAPYYGDWLAAERRFDAVLAIDPRHAATRDARAFMLNAVGRTREGALDRVELSRDHPMDAGIQYRLIYALWMLGRIGEADRTASRAMELWPRHPGIWFGRLWLLACTGRLDRALAHIEDADARPKLPPPMVAALGGSVRAAASGRCRRAGGGRRQGHGACRKEHLGRHLMR